jgi:hypothetical protein
MSQLSAKCLSKTTLSKMFKQRIIATLNKMFKQIYLTIASEPSPIAFSRRSNCAVLRARKQQFSRTLLGTGVNHPKLAERLHSM